MATIYSARSDLRPDFSAQRFDSSGTFSNSSLLACCHWYRYLRKLDFVILCTVSLNSPADVSIHVIDYSKTSTTYFYHAMLCIARPMPSSGVRLSLSLSFVYCVEMSSPKYSHTILVFYIKPSRNIPTESSPYGGVECMEYKNSDCWRIALSRKRYKIRP